MSSTFVRRCPSIFQLFNRGGSPRSSVDTHAFRTDAPPLALPAGKNQRFHGMIGVAGKAEQVDKPTLCFDPICQKSAKSSSCSGPRARR